MSDKEMIIKLMKLVSGLSKSQGQMIKSLDKIVGKIESLEIRVREVEAENKRYSI